MREKHYLDKLIIGWFKKRGISIKTIDDFSIHWNSSGIHIPIKNEAGHTIFSKHRRLPHEKDGPKYKFDVGGIANLYGQQYLHNKDTVVITEGELDALVMHSHNITAVSSTNGSKTFKPEWAELLSGKKVYICYDNDEAGGQGMALLYKYFPNAWYIFVPEQAQVKDISDYHERGGDVTALLDTAIQFKGIDDIQKDLERRKANWQQIHFHRYLLEEKIKEEKKYIHKPSQHKGNFDNDKERAKAVPITDIISFSYDRKRKCIFHNENTGSMTYYPETNTFYCWGCGKGGDVITIVQQQYNLSFKQAMDFLNSNKYLK